MPSPQRDRGIRAEREACALLTELTGFTVMRMANQGIRQDIGDLIGLPDTTIQVSAVPRQPKAIAARTRLKLAGLEAQQRNAGTRHGVVILRIDGNNQTPPAWRAVITETHLERLGLTTWGMPYPDTTIGQAILNADGWTHLPAGWGRICAPLETWCNAWANVPRFTPA